MVSQTMEFLINTLLVAGIIALVGTVIYLRVRATTSIEERRSIERRVGVLESEMKDLRKVYVSLGKIDTNIEHILQSLHDAAHQLVGLSSWQKERESAIDEAVQFIREARSDGIRPKK